MIILYFFSKRNVLYPTYIYTLKVGVCVCVHDSKQVEIMVSIYIK
jgi:hypothetical protein